MARKDIYKDAKGFDKHPENINRTGANRKLISTVNMDLEAKGITEASKADILGCYLRLIQLPLNDLKAMVEENSQPGLVRIVGKAILSGKGFEVIEKMLDRTIGTAAQVIEHKIDSKNITGITFDPE